MLIQEKFNSSALAFLAAALLGGCVSPEGGKPGVILPASVLRTDQSVAHRFAVVGEGSVKMVILGSRDPAGPYIGEALISLNSRNLSEFLSADSSRSGEKIYTLTSEAFAGSEISGSPGRRGWTGSLQRGYGRAFAAPFLPEIQVQILRPALNKDSFAKVPDCRLFIFGNIRTLFGLEYDESGAGRLLQIGPVDGVTSNAHMLKFMSGSCVQYAASYGRLGEGPLYNGHVLLDGSKVPISWRVVDVLTYM